MNKVIDIGLEGTQHVPNRNPVLGAIVGDIVGSRFEFNNHKSKDFEFINDECFFTDDTVHTLAIYKAVRESRNLEEFKVNVKNEIVKFTMRYPKMTYGVNFINWINSGAKEPYGSCGNGSAMRVSGIPYVINDYISVEKYATESAKITHNHPEGIKGAACVAGIIHMLLRYRDFEHVYTIACSYYPNIRNMSINNLRETYEYDETCQNTVPQAIVCFLESVDFEDAIRNAISIGGDSDTLAAITGSISAAYYGIPSKIERKALKKLDNFLLKIYQER